MPNWCNNSIKISGDKKMISTLVRVIESTKDTEDKVFQSLIGYPDHMTKADYDKDWYDTNIGWFGTKWDVSYDTCNMVRISYKGLKYFVFSIFGTFDNPY